MAALQHELSEKEKTERAALEKTNKQTNKKLEEDLTAEQEKQKVVEKNLYEKTGNLQGKGRVDPAEEDLERNRGQWEEDRKMTFRMSEAPTQAHENLDTQRCQWQKSKVPHRLTSSHPLLTYF